MEKTAVDRELIALEKEYWDALKRKDSVTCARLSDDPCVVVGPQGIGDVDKKTLAKMVESGPSELQTYKLDERDLHIRKLADDVALIAYKVHEKVKVEGEPVILDAFDSSVWVRRDGKWVCALHTETLAGDPFGRH